MMNRRGFTLVELMVVIGLIGILLTLATHDFSTWQRKSQVERYTKELYSEVQDARMRAAFTKVRQSVEFGAQQVVFRKYTTNEPDTAGSIISTKKLPLSFTLNGGWANPIFFDTRGIMSDPIVKVICMTTGVDAAYDALIITPALTNMGKVTNRGGACDQTNVTQK